MHTGALPLFVSYRFFSRERSCSIHFEASRRVCPLVRSRNQRLHASPHRPIPGQVKHLSVATVAVVHGRRASGRRRVMSVGRLEMPTFSSLNLDGSSSPTPSSAPPSCPPPLCYEDCKIPEQHCEACGRCEFLCIEHSGCDCEEPYFDPTEIECAICYCTREVRLV